MHHIYHSPHPRPPNVQCLDGQEVPYNVFISNPNKQESYTCKITYTLN